MIILLTLIPAFIPVFLLFPWPVARAVALGPLLCSRSSVIFVCGPLTPGARPWAHNSVRSGCPWPLALSSSCVFDPQDIVTESNKFDLVGFIPLLRERIYSNNQYARQFIISWVRASPMTVSPAIRSLWCSRICPLAQPGQFLWLRVASLLNL